MPHSFIDLGLHFGLCENESYSNFVAKICLRNRDFLQN